MDNLSRKLWAQMTGAEITELKKRQCVKCRYFSRNAEGSGSSTCDYIAYVGHSRGCDPRDCVEKGIFTPKKGRRKTNPFCWKGEGGESHA